ncbi:hypothetical protein Pr1d_04620 [Bythopirellula goksoeyrii]|uniref:Uncharacterized protein n=1 Tax=Bythopirellula goksoeyrii TaxID=1400387 RepID=A0A5B9QFT7_9BACT|nr:hypothetical protein Pr1d_04620 [Bythopirellula goksoeyrii]
MLALSVSASGLPIKFTTGVRVVPDVLPHQDLVAPEPSVESAVIDEMD